MKTTRVALFKGSVDAERLRQRLLQAGIQAVLHGEPALAKFWFVSRAEAGVRLEVPVDSLERAGQLLAEWEAADGLLEGAFRCPECHSLRVDYPQFTQKSLITNLAMGLAAELRLVEREYYCEDCHCMWAKTGSKPRRVRPHSAPNYFIEGID